MDQHPLHDRVGCVELAFQAALQGKLHQSQMSYGILSSFFDDAVALWIVRRGVAGQRLSRSPCNNPGLHLHQRRFAVRLQHDTASSQSLHVLDGPLDDPIVRGTLLNARLTKHHARLAILDQQRRDLVIGDLLVLLAIVPVVDIVHTHNW